jgi:hypothetical protein
MEWFFRIQEQQRRLFNDLRDGGLGWRVTSPHGTASLAVEDARSQLSYQTAPRTGSSRQGLSSSQLSSGSGPVVLVPGVQPVPVPPPLHSLIPITPSPPQVSVPIHQRAIRGRGRTTISPMGRDSLANTRGTRVRQVCAFFSIAVKREIEDTS